MCAFARTAYADRHSAWIWTGTSSRLTPTLIVRSYLGWRCHLDILCALAVPDELTFAVFVPETKGPLALSFVADLARPLSRGGAS